MATVKGIPRAERFWSKVLKTDGCWLWRAGVNNNGYGRFQYYNRIERPKLGRDLYAHRVAWLLTFGEIPGGLNVLHKCDTPRCVRPDHLFLGTQLENVKDCQRKGRKTPPPLNNAKLTPEQVRAIRIDQRKHHIIAAQYGLKRLAVWNIKHRRSWSSLD